MLTPAPKDHVFSAIWPTNAFLWFVHKIYVKTKDIIISIPQDTLIPF